MPTLALYFFVGGCCVECVIVQLIPNAGQMIRTLFHKPLVHLTQLLYQWSGASWFLGLSVARFSKNFRKIALFWQMANATAHLCACFAPTTESIWQISQTAVEPWCFQPIPSRHHECHQQYDWALPTKSSLSFAFFWRIFFCSIFLLIHILVAFDKIFIAHDFSNKKK